jgi:hypothetical protein
MCQNIPRAYFDQHARPNYEEWLRNRRDERLAKNAVMTASIMAARVLYYWKDRDPGQVYGAQNEHEYREALAARECADFALVRDVADTHRHVEITRASRQITRYDQTADKPHDGEPRGAVRGAVS